MDSEAFGLGDTERWYAAATQPHKEAVALANLRRQGVRSFLPMERRTVRHARKVRDVLSPVFRGYVFLILDAAGTWSHVNGTHGVRRLVHDAKGPIPVRRGVVETLLATTDDAGVVSFIPEFAAGDVVRLVRGPFAEQIGTILRMDAQGRVAMLFELFGRPVRATVSGTDLRRLGKG